jgi:hypothetical protein
MTTNKRLTRDLVAKEIWPPLVAAGHQPRAVNDINELASWLVARLATLATGILLCFYNALEGEIQLLNEPPLSGERAHAQALRSLQT